MTEFGELLRQARERKGVSTREAERATRISKSYLEALEAHDFTTLPAATYARGIVRNYAGFLGLDPAEMLGLYEELTGTRSESFEVMPATKPLDMSSHWAPNFAIIAFMVVMSLVIFTWMYSAYFQQPGSTATGTVGVSTVTPVPDSIMAAIGTQPTVATQGGGVATITPTNTATATVEPTATTPAATETPIAATEAPVIVAATEPPAVDEPVEPPVTVGAHSFVVWAVEEVWVQITVNGDIVVDDVLPAGAERVFDGDSLSVTSGNSAYVLVYVDGEEFTLGDTWDATFVYP